MKMTQTFLTTYSLHCPGYELEHTYGLVETSTGDIDWENDCVKPYASKSGLYHQLLNIHVRKDNYLDQLVIEPTRITEDTENALDLFFSNNHTLVNKVQVIPGISDHETEGKSLEILLPRWVARPTLHP